MESIRNNQILLDDVLAHAQEEKTDDAITNMFKHTAIIKPYMGEAAED